MSYAQQTARNLNNYQYSPSQSQQGGQNQGQGQRPGSNYYDNGARSYDLQGQNIGIRNIGSGLNPSSNRSMMTNSQQGPMNPQIGGHVSAQLHQPVMNMNTLATTGMGVGVDVSGAGVTNDTSSMHAASGHSATHSHSYQQQQQQQQHSHHSHLHQHQHQLQHQHQHQHPQHQHGYPSSHTHGHSHQHFGTMPTSSTDNTLTNVPSTSKSNVQTGSSSINLSGYSTQPQMDLMNSSDILSNNQQLGEIRISHASASASSQGAMDNLDNNTSNLLNQDGSSSTTPHAMASGISAGMNESGQVSQGVQTQTQTQSSEKVQNIEAATFTREELLWRGTEYEVKCDETFAFYTGFVVDYDPKQQKATVYYENGWKPASQVPLDYIRPVPPETDYNTWEPVEGDRVEVKAKAEESEPYGWWAAAVRRVRGKLYLIGFEGWGGGHDQVLDLDMLRPFCTTKPFSPIDLERFRVKIPPEVIPFCKTRNAKSKFAKDFKLIRERLGLFHLGFGPQSEDIIVIGTKKQESAVKVLDYLWELEKTSTDEEKKLIEAEEKAQHDYETLKNCYKIEFRFDEKFTKHVIGAQRSYVSKAEKIPGVKHVSVTDGYCAIFADSYEAAADARQLLELSMDTIDIPIECRRDLIGPEGQNIIKLQNDSQVILISTWNHYCKSAGIEYDPTDIPPNKVRMVIFGPKEHVAQAKSVIEDEVKMILKKFEIDRREMEADRELRQWSSYSHYDKENETYYQQDSGERRERGPRDEYSGNTQDVAMEQRKRRRGGATDRGSRGRGQLRGAGRGDYAEDANAQGGYRTRQDSRNEPYAEQYDKSGNDKRKTQSRNNQYENYESSRQYGGYGNKNAEYDERYGNVQSSRKDEDQYWDETNAAEQNDYADKNRNTGYDENAEDYYGEEYEDYDYNSYKDDNREYGGDTSGRSPRYGGNRRDRKSQAVYVQKGTSRPQSSGNTGNQ